MKSVRVSRHGEKAHYGKGACCGRGCCGMGSMGSEISMKKTCMDLDIDECRPGSDMKSRTRLPRGTRMREDKY